MGNGDILQTASRNDVMQAKQRMESLNALWLAAYVVSEACQL
jgi:hypothetical protein